MNDRPLSRRGDLGSAVSNSSENMRPLTAMRQNSRPQSSVGGRTATRLASSLGQQSQSRERIGTALENAGNMIAVRPITQHGLSGLPTSSEGRRGSAISGKRQIKDKRYWLGALKIKMEELIIEMERLKSEKKKLDREKSAKKMYEIKVKETAKELTDCQSSLTDMNLALESFSSGQSRQNMQNETLVVRERNDNAQNQLEVAFRERQQKENQNKEIEKKLNEENNNINDMVLSLTQDKKKNYKDLQMLSKDLKNQNIEIHNDIESVFRETEHLRNTIVNSQYRMEAVRLQTKLKELTTKRNIFREKENSKLSPANEREKLINEVRTNNQSLSKIARQMKIIEDQLNEKKELLNQVEQDLEDGNSERHAKYKELKRRDDTMTQFMDTFIKSMENEKQNVETLKNQIAYSIEQITLQGMNMKLYGIKRSEMFNENNDLNSHSGLVKEYKKLTTQLKQLQILEKRTLNQFQALKDEENVMINEIKKFSNFEALRSETTDQTEELINILDDLKSKKRVTEKVLNEAKERNQAIKGQLKSNETYRQISHLEEKYNDLIRDQKFYRSSIDESVKEFNYSDAKYTAECTLKQFMDLMNNK